MRPFRHSASLEEDHAPLSSVIDWRALPLPQRLELVLVAEREEVDLDLHLAHLRVRLERRREVERLDLDTHRARGAASYHAAGRHNTASGRGRPKRGEDIGRHGDSQRLQR